MTDLALRYGLTFEGLYRREGLESLDAAFVAHLKDGDIELFNRLMAARRDPDALEAKLESELLIALAPHLEDFIGKLFGIEAETRALQERHDVLARLYTVKRLFVQRRAVKGMTSEQAAAINGEGIAEKLAALMAEALNEENRSRAMSRAGPTMKPRIRLRSILPRNTPLGRCCRRLGARSTARAFYSRCRISSICSISCRSRRSSRMASR